MFFVDAFGSQSLEEPCAGFAQARLGVDALDQALLDRFLERHLVETPAHRVAVFKNVANEFVEEGADAAMRGNDRESSAPGRNRLGDSIEQALVLMQGELVQLHMTALAGQCVRVG